MDIRLPRIGFLHQDHPSAQTLGWMALSINIVATATYTIFAKMLIAGLSPFSMLFFSEILTIFFTLFLFGTVPTIRHLLRVRRESIGPMLVVGVCNGILGPLLWFLGLRYSSAVNATLFSNAEMVFMILFAVLVLGEKWRGLHIMAMAAIITGIGIISFRDLSFGMGFQAGDALLLLAAFSFSIGSLVFRQYLNKEHAELVVLVRSILPVTVFFLLSPFLQVPFIAELQGLSWKLVLVLLGFGFISRFMNTYTFYEAMERLPVSVVSAAGNMSVIVALLFAHFGLGEELTRYHIIGAAAIILGMVLLEQAGMHPSEEHRESHLTEKKTHRL